MAVTFRMTFKAFVVWSKMDTRKFAAAGQGEAVEATFKTPLPAV
jgi:hypothetical protein